MPDDMTTDKGNLLPCPFCGSEAAEHRREDNAILVGCSECGVSMIGNDHFHPGNQWNTRSSPAPVQPLKSARWEDCPHCKFEEGVYGSHLAEPCALHQRIFDLSQDAGCDAQVLASLNSTVREVIKTLGGCEEDDPVLLARNRMEEIQSFAEAEDALPSDDELIEKVARAVRRGQFERLGRLRAYDPEAQLTEGELDDARNALAALSAKPPVQSDSCLSKKLPDEPYFVLLGRDPQAPDLVEKWAADRQFAEGWSQKVAGAVLIAALMRAFKDENPDLGMSAALLASPSAPEEWQDISTAPKVYSPPLSQYNHHAPQILGLWGQAFYCVCRWGGPSAPYWVDGDNRKVPFQPTRWRPLPAPPQGEQR